MRSLTRQSPCAKMKLECSEDQMELQTADHLILFLQKGKVQWN